MHSESWIDKELEELRAHHAERKLIAYPIGGGRVRVGDRFYLNFSSNDYLDFANHPRVIQAAVEALDRYGAGAGASRLVTGTLDLHTDVEERLAAFKGYPAALLFGSGYLANLGVITALAGREDTIYADRLAHASIIDAAVLSRARLVRFHHNDVEHLAALLRESTSGRRIIVTESVFSMDGDLAPLRQIADLAAQHDAMLLVDEAHALGILGPGGRGLISEWNLQEQVAVCIGTLSKAFGSYGGFAACSERMRDYLVNRARSLIYSTALPPPVLGAALGALTLLEGHPGLPEILRQRAALFRGLLQRANLNILRSESQIVPVVVGTNQTALTLSERLRDRGILAVAIRPPTVPEGSSRLRFSVTLAHEERELIGAANTIIAEVRSLLP
jgi:8-amino-7-oxononanoate synthase